MRLTDLTVKHLAAPSQGQKIHFDDALKGFGLRVSQGGTKTWVLVQGKERKQTTIGRYPDLTLKDARKQAVSLIATPCTPEPPSASITTQKAAMGFLEAKERQTKKGTVYQYGLYLKAFTLDVPLEKLKKADIQAYLKQYDATLTSQNYAHGTMRTFLNWCVEQDYIEHSPLGRLKAPNRLRSRERVLTNEELKKIWDASDYFPYGHYVRCLILTGQRKMEIYNLKVIANPLIFPNTKNGTDQVLPLTPLVKEHLKPFNINHWSTQKDRLDRLSGVSDWRLHDLRRTLATNMAKLDVQEAVIERILNHVNGGVKGTYNRYRYQPQMEEALLTYEAFIKTLTLPGQQPGSLQRLLLESSNDTDREEATKGSHVFISPTLSAT